MSVCIHIGPPKTATASLQKSIFPALGVPFENRPAWTRALARDPAFAMPPRDDSDLIVSDEMLGDFAAVSPERLAARLASIFAKAKILFCVRDPLESFYSYYRQRVMTEIELQSQALRKGFRYEPVTPAQFLASQWAELGRSGSGFFATIDTARIKAAFERHFSFQTLNFALLRRDPDAFAASVIAACGGGGVAKISWENKTSAAKLEEALALLPAEAPAGLADRYRAFFQMELTPEYEEFVAIGPPRRYLPVATSDLMLGKLG